MLRSVFSWFHHQLQEECCQYIPSVINPDLENGKENNTSRGLAKYDSTPDSATCLVVLTDGDLSKR